MDDEEYEEDVSVWEPTLIAQTISLSLISLIFFLLECNVYKGLHLHMYLEKRDYFGMCVHLSVYVYVLRDKAWDSICFVV